MTNQSALQNSNFKNPLPVLQVMIAVCKDPHKDHELPVLSAY